MSTCVVFGGSKGIGQAIARRFVQENCRVAVSSRNKDNLEACLHNIKTKGDEQVEVFECDVINEDQIKHTISAVTSLFGPVDVLVNAAGISRDGLLVRMSHSDMTAQLNTNLIGPMLTSKVVLRSMLPRKKGCIINIGSVVGSKGNAGQCIYSASKAGLEGFTRSLAKEVASCGIRVNLIAPGFIETAMTAKLKRTPELHNMIPLGRVGQAEEVAHLANYLVDAHYVTGQVLYVDGGLHINL